jgi:hypothetical protein
VGEIPVLERVRRQLLVLNGGSSGNNPAFGVGGGNSLLSAANSSKGVGGSGISNAFNSSTAGNSRADSTRKGDNTSLLLSTSSSKGVAGGTKKCASSGESDVNAGQLS